MMLNQLFITVDPVVHMLMRVKGSHLECKVLRD